MNIAKTGRITLMETDTKAIISQPGNLHQHTAVLVYTTKTQPELQADNRSYQAEAGAALDKHATQAYLMPVS